MARSTPSGGIEHVIAAAAHADSAIAIVDAGRLRRECLSLAMSHFNPERHVLEAAGAKELLDHVAAGSSFDLLLVGAATLELIDMDQIETLRHALPDTPLVVVAETDDPHRTRQLLAVGVRGVLPASLSLQVLMGAVDLVLAGGVYLPSSLIDAGTSRAIALPGTAQAAEPWPELTRRQRDVLAFISQGKSNKLIADALSMSESTVKAHVKQIIRRLNVANRTQAALVATGHGAFPRRARESNGIDDAVAAND
jgi:DNA-binding NarL/FixJ family response regulator